MNDFIFNVLPAQGPTLPMCIPLVGGLPYNSPLIGSLLGVLLGFAINNRWTWFKDKRSSVHYIKLFKNDLNKAKTTLEKDKKDELFTNPLKKTLPSKIQIDSWTSVVNNGDLRLFDPKEIDCLNYIYSRFRDYNDEIQLYKSSSSFYSFPVGTNITENSGYYQPREYIGELNTKLIDGIGVVNRKEWMASEHWWQRIRP